MAAAPRERCAPGFVVVFASAGFSPKGAGMAVHQEDDSRVVLWLDFIRGVVATACDHQSRYQYGIHVSEDSFLWIAVSLL